MRNQVAEAVAPGVMEAKWQAGEGRRGNQREIAPLTAHRLAKGRYRSTFLPGNVPC